MSTRCRIGIQNKDGTITSIYCHHDGYPKGVGEVLVNHYKTEEKIRKLLELGDMSSIGTEPVDNPNAWKTPGEGAILGGNWNELWQKLHPDNMCDTYASRGEDAPASTDATEDDYVKRTKDCWGEYAYLFKDGKWFITDTESEFVPLEHKLTVV